MKPLWIMNYKTAFSSCNNYIVSGFFTVSMHWHSALQYNRVLSIVRWNLSFGMLRLLCTSSKVVNLLLFSRRLFFFHITTIYDPTINPGSLLLTIQLDAHNCFGDLLDNEYCSHSGHVHRNAENGYNSHCSHSHRECVFDKLPMQLWF